MSLIFKKILEVLHIVDSEVNNNRMATVEDYQELIKEIDSKIKTMKEFRKICVGRMKEIRERRKG